MQANELRGEVDITLDGMAFVLRPSREAVLACEQKTGMSLIEMAVAADDGSLRLGEAAIITTEMIQAWGRAAGENPGVEQRTASAVNTSRVEELIYEFGIMATLPRLAIVLSRAASGGVTASGEVKAPGTTTEPIPGAEKPVSRPQRSAGPRKNTGGRRATNSGQRSKPGNS